MRAAPARALRPCISAPLQSAVTAPSVVFVAAAAFSAPIFTIAAISALVAAPAVTTSVVALLFRLRFVAHVAASFNRPTSVAAVAPTSLSSRRARSHAARLGA